MITKHKKPIDYRITQGQMAVIRSMYMADLGDRTKPSRLICDWFYEAFNLSLIISSTGNKQPAIYHVEFSSEAEIVEFILSI
jgi:hypothetical protein